MSKSKFGLVYSNERGTKAKIIVQDIENSGLAVAQDEAEIMVGIAYDHQYTERANGGPSLPGREIYTIPLLTHTAFNGLLGKVMTVLDATTSDPVQRKALKDVLSSQLNSWEKDLRDMVRDTYQGVDRNATTAQTVEFSEQK